MAADMDSLDEILELAGERVVGANEARYKINAILNEVEANLLKLVECLPFAEYRGEFNCIRYAIVEIRKRMSNIVCHACIKGRLDDDC